MPPLIKFVDSSLLPASIMILTKVLGLYLAVNLFNIEWQVNFVNDSIASVYPVVYAEDLVLVSSFSDFLMLIVMTVGLAFQVYKAKKLHDTHIDPLIVVRLAAANLMSLIKDSYTLFREASIWSLFTLIANVVVFLNAFQGKTFLWVPVAFLLLNLSLYSVLARDFEDELDRAKKNLKF